MENNNRSSGGIGFRGLLTIVFIVMKFLDKITWPWFWVLSPILIPLCLYLLLLLVGIVIEFFVRSK